MNSIGIVVIVPLFVSLIPYVKIRASSVVLGSLALALAVLAGHEQTVTYLVLTVFLYGVLSSAFKVSRPRAVSRVALRPLLVIMIIGVLAFGLAAIQVFPSLEAARLSVRDVLPYAIFTHDSPSLRDFAVTFRHPLLRGGLLYVNDLAFLLTVVAIVGVRWRKETTRGTELTRQVGIWASIALVTFLLCLGGNSPLYKLMYHVPFYNTFRAPYRNNYGAGPGAKDLRERALALRSDWVWDRVGRGSPRFGSCR